MQFAEHRPRFLEHVAPRVAAELIAPGVGLTLPPAVRLPRMPRAVVAVAIQLHGQPLTAPQDGEGDPQAGPLRDLFTRIGAVDGRGGILVTSGAGPAAAGRFLAIGEAATLLFGGENLTPAWSAVRQRVRCEGFLRELDAAARKEKD